LSAETRVTKLQEFVYELKVEQVMTKDVVTAPPDLHMRELRGILQKNSISGVPVVVSSGLVGLVSIEDFIKWLADGGADCLVSARMSRQVVTIPEDAPIAEAISKFEQFKYGRLPVVCRGGNTLAGIITKSDIVRGLLTKLEIEYMEEEIHTYRASHIFQDIAADRAFLRFDYHVQGGDFRRAGECASGLKRTLKRLGIHPRAIRRVAIVAYEAEMNVIIYASSGEITVEVEPTEIRVCIKDEGPGIADIEQAMRPGYSTAPDWVRELGFGAGMGLENIRRCSDGMKLDSTVGKGTVLNVNVSLMEEVASA